MSNRRNSDRLGTHTERVVPHVRAAHEDIVVRCLVCDRRINILTHHSGDKAKYCPKPRRCQETATRRRALGRPIADAEFAAGVYRSKKHSKRPDAGAQWS